MRHRLSSRAWLETVAIATFVASGAVSTSRLAAQDTSAKPDTAAAHDSTTPAQTVAVPAAEPLAFTDATVIDVTDGNLLADQTVLVVGNRIQAMGPANKVHVPREARVVDARGKFLLPGFWDMHAHTERVPGDAKVQVTEYRRAYPLYVANGVTGIREMAQRFSHGADSFRVWQRDVMDGKRIGPRAVGPSADLTYNIKLQTPEDARHVVDSLKAAGDAFIKYHDSGGDSTLFFAVLREARRAGIPVVGHVPASVPVAEAIDSGIASVEHINEHHGCSPTPDSSPETEAGCRAIAEAYLRTGAWLDPTFAVFYYIGESEDDVANYRAFMRMMRKLGVTRFLAGSDCEPFIMKNWGLDRVCHRGFAALQEVIALKEAGLTPLEALQTATLNPARFFNSTDSLGTVATGKLADLVLLDANPLLNIRNILKIQGVMANGRYYDRALLDRIDPRGIKMAALYAEGQPDIKKEPPSADDGEPVEPASPTK